MECCVGFGRMWCAEENILGGLIRKWRLKMELSPQLSYFGLKMASKFKNSTSSKRHSENCHRFTLQTKSSHKIKKWFESSRKCDLLKIPRSMEWKSFRKFTINFLFLFKFVEFLILHNCTISNRQANSGKNASKQHNRYKFEQKNTY